MAQGLKGLNQGGGYDWETPYLNYLVNLSSTQQNEAQRLFQEYKVAKEYLANNNIELAESPMEDFASLFHTIYTQQNPQQEQLLTPPEDVDINLDPSKFEYQGDSYMGFSPDITTNTQRMLEEFEENHPYYKEAAARLKEYYDNIDDFNENYSNKLKSDLALPQDRKDIESIKETAWRVSPYYRMYGDRNLSGAGVYINLDDDEWLELSVVYDHLKQNEGEDEANAYLNARFQNEAASNQSTLEQYWNGFTGMGASAYGSLMTFVGALQGVADYLASPEDFDIDGLNGFEQFIYAMENSDLATYGNDVVKYGTLSTSNIKFAKENGQGLSYKQIMRKAGDDEIFTRSLVPELLQQGGFTAASMLIGGAEAKLAKGIFKGLARLSKQAIKDPKKLYKMFRFLGKAHQFNNNYVVPMIAGTAEGLVEGRQTQDQAYADGMRYLNSIQEDMYDQAYQDVMKDHGYQVYEDAYSKFHEGQKPINVNTENLPEDEWLKQILSSPAIDEVDQAVKEMVMKTLWEEINTKYAEEFNKAKEQIEYASAQAGVNNFILNSFINGVANQTLKAGIHNQSVQRTLANSKPFGWASPKGSLKVTGTVGNATATGKYGFGAKTWDVIKEPLGEFGEEYLQTVSDAAVRGGADYNIHTYIDHLYNDGVADAIGTTYEGQSRATWAALGESAKSWEAVKAGIYGAFSSAIGTPMIRKSNYFSAREINPETGKAEGKKFDAFKRRETGDSKKESVFEYLNRVTPWRSSIGEGIRRVQEKSRAIEHEAQAMNDWLSDLDNQDKFKTINGSISWGRQMQDAAQAGDEFGYRNSNLGKTITDAMMLGKLKKSNPGMYENLIAHYQELAKLDPNSEKAQQIAADYNGSVLDDNLKVTPEELKKNAQHVLDVMDDVQKEDQDLRSTFGDLDEDVRQSLIYGRLMMKDWEKRGKSLDQEISTVLSNTNLKDSVKGIHSSREFVQGVIARYGSNLESLLSKSKEFKEEASKLDEEAAQLKREAHHSKNEDSKERKNAKAKTAKAKAKTLRREAKDIDEAIKLSQKTTGQDLVMSESEILRADPTLRGEMLNPNNYKKFSKEQQKVIDRVLNAGQMTLGSKFVSKVVDSGRLTRETNKFMQQYGDLIMHPESLKFYAASAKREAEKSFARKQAESIAKIQNFAEFSNAIDRTRYNGSNVQQNILFRTLKEKAPQRLQSYLNYKNDSEELLNQLENDEAFKNLFDDDKALTTYAVNYLSNNPISDTETYRDNPEYAVARLLDKDDEGKSMFKKYVESVLPPEVSINRFDFSDEHVADLYRNLINRANKNRANVKNAEEETPTDDSDPSSDPVVEQSPAEEKPKGGSGKTSPWSSIPTNPDEEPATNPAEEAVEEFTVDPNIAEQVNNIREYINSSEVGNPDPKNAQAIEAIEQQLNLRDVKDTTDLLNQLTSIINDYKINGDTSLQKAAQVLDWARVKLMGATASPTSSGSSLFARMPNAYPDSKDMSTLSFEQSKYSSNPDDRNFSWIKKLIEDYQVVEFLRTGVITAETPVYFYTDASYMSTVEESMKRANKTMGIKTYPLILVVEVTSEADKQFAFAIEGKDSKTHYYRPIGVMPGSENKGILGAASTQAIRDSINLKHLGELITDQNGKVLESRVKRIVSKIPSKGGANPQAAGGYYRRDLVDLIMEAFVPKTELASIKEALKDPQKRRAFMNSERFKSIVRSFFEDAAKSSRFKKKRNKGVESLYYTASTLFIPHTNGGNPNEMDWIVPTKDLIDTTNLDGDKFVDVLKSRNGKDIRDFNSRTRRYIDKMISILKDFNPIDETSGSPKLSVTKKDGYFVSTNDSLKELEKISKQLTDSLRDFITFSNRNGINAEYSIQLAENEDGSGYHYNLILKNSLGDINLGSIWESTFKQNRFGVDEAANVLTNLCLDENVGIRKDPTAGKYRELVKWGVSYPDIMGTGTNQDMAAENRLDLIADNILAMSVSSLVAEPTAVEIHQPENYRVVDNTPVNPETKVAQPDQATLNPVGPGGQGIAAITTDGSTVHEDGLVVEKGEKKPINKSPLIEELTSRSISSRENIEYSSGGTMLTVAGTTTYYRLPNAMNAESSIELSQEEEQNLLNVMGYEVISSPITVKYQLPVTNMDGTTVQVNLANDQVRLLVDYSLNEPKVGMLIKATSLTDDVKEMVALTWHMAESYLGRQIDFAKVSLQDGRGGIIHMSKSDLKSDLHFDTPLSRIFLDRINQTATPESQAISTSSEEINLTKINPIVEDDLDTTDYSTLDDFESDLAENKEEPSESNLPKTLQQPAIQYGVWQKEDGSSRTQQEIEAIEKKFEAFERVHNAEEYNTWLEQSLGDFKDPKFVIQSIQQIIEC